MLNIAICDDEKEYLDFIKAKVSSILKSKDINYKVDCYTSGHTFLKKNRIYDIVFFDIEMPEMNGMELAEKYIQYSLNSFVIFLTYHTELSRQGYKVNAFRFLDKRDVEEELKEALYTIESILRNKVIEIKASNGEVCLLDCSDILYIECIAKQRKIRVVCLDQELISSETLASIGKRISNKDFYLSHRSFLVNLKYVRSWESNKVILTTGHSVLLSEKKRNEFRHIYLNWKFERSYG